MQDLRLHKATIIYPGDRAYPLDEKIGVIPVSQIETAFDDKLG